MISELVVLQRSNTATGEDPDLALNVCANAIVR